MPEDRLSNPEVRVRFAPSPTGYLHVGGLRTALYNCLFARKHHGVFILRIEDTDRTRLVEGAVENLIQSLRWAGLDYDEGPGKDGPYGPYVQSQRLAIYRERADYLLQTDHAYRCFCTSERLEAMRKSIEKSKQSFKYDRTCLGLPESEVVKKVQDGVPYTIRMRVPDHTTVAFCDLVRQDVEINTANIDDQILIKSDGYPTYHMANVVDDHLMQISHVIRGEEWLSSTPKHVLLYRYFGWQPPAFAHLPLLLNPDRSKLSKRQGDVAVEDYRAKGYLSEALVNFVALLGWNPGDDREIFDRSGLVQEFSIERVNKAGAIFNLEKLNWLNEQHLRAKPSGELREWLREMLPDSGAAFSDDYLDHAIRLLRERISFPQDLLRLGSYFFQDPTTYDPEGIRKRWKEDSAAWLATLVSKMETVEAFTSEGLEVIYKEIASSLGVSNSELIHPTRLAISGLAGGPGLFELMEVLGRDTVIRRIRRALAVLSGVG
ncbi:MAG: glutamate--tRNA ligase [Acidobacteria bacterium]|nr:glutamate--tRNA ligase [Acidobacteriota bacterium]MBI3656712.1 glutamate--tRNA ligase [Acidobacteriota bacterium]